MTDYKIEKGVPLPAAGGSPGRRRAGPLWNMEVGDSVFMADKLQSQVATMTASPKRALGWTFTTRKVEGGVRVWRVS